MHYKAIALGYRMTRCRSRRSTAALPDGSYSKMRLATG